MIRYVITGPDSDGLFRLDEVTVTKRRWWVGHRVSKFFMGYFSNYMGAHMAQRRYEG